MAKNGKWKTILLYGVAPILLLAALVTAAILGQVRANDHSPAAGPSETASTSAAPAAFDAAQACEYVAPRMVRAWAAGDLERHQDADAMIGKKTDPMPDMSADQYVGALLYQTADTATCSVVTGSDEGLPFTVGLRLVDGDWKVALLRLPGATRP